MEWIIYFLQPSEACVNTPPMDYGRAAIRGRGATDSGIGYLHYQVPSQHRLYPAGQEYLGRLVSRLGGDAWERLDCAAYECDLRASARRGDSDIRGQLRGRERRHLKSHSAKRSEV